MLRMEKVMQQMPGLVDGQRQQVDVLREMVDAGRAVLDGWRADPAAAEERIQRAMADSQASFALALHEHVDEAFASDAAPAQLVIAADGSSIDPDRFAPVQCYLVNIGWVVLPYGVDIECRLDSTPDMGPLEKDEKPQTRQAGAAPSPLVGVSLRRDVGELVKASQLATELAGQCPTAVLLDGTLLPWELDAQRVPKELRDRLRRDTLDALKSLEDAARPLTVGAYISRSSASDVVRSLCALDPTFDPPWNVTDAVLFRAILRENGERSALFQVESAGMSIVETELRLPASQAVCFFYFRAGDDIARVEVPRWVADDPECVDLLQATLIDQCRRCDDYPRALQEAHEQAVISGGDRVMFRWMLDSEAARAGYHYPFGGKATSKLRRAL